MTNYSKTYGSPSNNTLNLPQTPDINDLRNNDSIYNRSPILNPTNYNSTGYLVYGVRINCNALIPEDLGVEFPFYFVHNFEDIHIFEYTSRASANNFYGDFETVPLNDPLNQLTVISKRITFTAVDLDMNFSGVNSNTLNQFTFSIGSKTKDGLVDFIQTISSSKIFVTLYTINVSEREGNLFYTDEYYCKTVQLAGSRIHFTCNRKDMSRMVFPTLRLDKDLFANRRNMHKSTVVDYGERF